MGALVVHGCMALRDDDVLKLSVSDIIVSQKGSNGETK